MKVYSVLAIFGGVPTIVESFRDRYAARRRALELATEYELLSKPMDWQKSEGRWDARQGSRRFWEHHWYSDEHDVVVEECVLR